MLNDNYINNGILLMLPFAFPFAAEFDCSVLLIFFYCLFSPFLCLNFFLFPPFLTIWAIYNVFV